MPMSKKVFRLKIKLAKAIQANELLSDRAEDLLKALKSGDSGLKCNDSRVVYQYAQLKEAVKEVKKLRKEIGT